MIAPEVENYLRFICPDGVSRNVDLSKASRWKIGGIADCVVTPSSIEELIKVVTHLRHCSLPYVVVGATSNILFDDKGLDAAIIQIGPKFAGVSFNDGIVTANAGAWVPGLALAIARAGFSGVEHICGIPGTIGGLVCMNGGSQRKSIAECLLDVTVLTPEGVMRTLNKSECCFSYRSSRFQSSGEIIVSVRLQLSLLANPVDIRHRMLAILRDRRSKFPRKMPNCGSVFKANDEMYSIFGPPGSVLDRLGFKGRRKGGAQVSLEHANFINNAHCATAEDVRDLAREMQKSVQSETGFVIQPEAYFFAFNGDVQPLI